MMPFISSLLTFSTTIDASMRIEAATSATLLAKTIQPRRTEIPRQMLFTTKDAILLLR